MKQRPAKVKKGEKWEQIEKPPVAVEDAAGGFVLQKKRKIGRVVCLRRNWAKEDPTSFCPAMHREGTVLSAEFSAGLRVDSVLP